MRKIFLVCYAANWGWPLAVIDQLVVVTQVDQLALQVLCRANKLWRPINSLGQIPSSWSAKIEMKYEPRN